MINIQEDFISLEELASVYSTMTDNLFPWYFTESVTYPKGKAGLPMADRHSDIPSKYDYLFAHMFYINNTSVSEYMGVLTPLLDKIKPSRLIRIKANLGLLTDKNYVAGMHTDTLVPNSTTSVFYLDTCDGATLFREGAKVYSKRNRIVSFDADLEHSTVTHTEGSPHRLVINFNYIK